MGTGVPAADLIACMMLEVTTACCSFIARLTSPLTMRCTWLRIDSCKLGEEKDKRKKKGQTEGYSPYYRNWIFNHDAAMEVSWVSHSSVHPSFPECIFSLCGHNI